MQIDPTSPTQMLFHDVLQQYGSCAQIFVAHASQLATSFAPVEQIECAHAVARSGSVARSGGVARSFACAMSGGTLASGGGCVMSRAAGARSGAASIAASSGVALLRSGAPLPPTEE